MEDLDKKIFDQTLKDWLERAQQVANGNLHISNNGRKYIRINLSLYAGTTNAAFCFIDKSNGDVLMAANYSAPAKHARGNIYEIGNEGITAYGAKYLR